MTEINRNCPNCGTQIPPDSTVCQNCGSELEVAAITEQERSLSHTDSQSSESADNMPTEVEVGKQSESTDNMPTEVEVGKQSESTDNMPTEVEVAKQSECESGKPSVIKKLQSIWKKHSKRVIIGGTALVLVICLLITGFGGPGFFLPKGKTDGQILGVSSITVSAKDKSVKAKTAKVSHDKPRAEFDSGLAVDFGKYNLQDTEKLSVRAIGKKSDNEYQAEIYDFDMSKTNKFPFLVEVTLPYNASWGDDVFVQYYNESTKQWELIWSEPDGKGKVSFLTDHFSTYAVFKRLVEEGGEKPENGDSLFIPLSKKLAMDTYCRLDIAALAKYVRENGLSNIGAITPGGWDTAGIESAIGILNNTGSFGTSMLDAYDFINSANDFTELTKTLNYLGNAMTILKLFLQADRTGNLSRAISDHSVDLTAMALSAAGNATAGLTATICNVAAFALLVYGTVDSVTSYVDLLGAENKTEYAYRNFTVNYLTYVLRENRIAVKYGRDEYERMKQSWQASEVSLRAAQPFGSPDYSQWAMTFDSIFKKNQSQPEIIVPAINSFLDSYCSIFWQLEDTNSRTYKNFLKETKSGALSLNSLMDVYLRPNAKERAMYSARLKNDLIKWLSPMLEEYLKKAFNATLNLLLQNALELEKELNTDISFTLVEQPPRESEDYFEPDVELKPFNPPENLEAVRIRQFKLDKELWELNKENKYTVSCSRYVYMLAGMPKFVDFYYSGEKEPTTITMNITCPKTYIKLGESAFPTLAELVGDYTDGKASIGGEYINEIFKALQELGGGNIAPPNKSYDAPFTLVMTSPNSGEYYDRSKMANKDNTPNGTFTYNEKTGELRVKLIKKEDGKDIEMVGTLYCTYLANKKKVQISGTISGIVQANLDLTAKIIGSKDIKK